MMRPYAKTMSAVAIAAVVTAILAFLAIPGCIDQNQDNSPISISNSSGRLVLSVTCSADGSIAYVADGRNVYRYDRNASGAAESWQCILSQGRRLEMAAKHDPRELPSQEDAQQNPDQGKGK